MVDVAAVCEDHTLKSSYSLHCECLFNIIAVILPLAYDGIGCTILVSCLGNLLYLPILYHRLISNEDVGSLIFVEIFHCTWCGRFNLEMHVAVNLEGEVTALDYSLTAADKEQGSDSDKE